jgi:hypothetical protein
MQSTAILIMQAFITILLYLEQYERKYCNRQE